MELTGSSSLFNTDPREANRSKCQGIGLLTNPKDITVFSRDLENQDHQDLSLIFLISILSTLIPVILIHGFISMFFLSLTTQAKLGPSRTIIVDDSAASNSAIVVAASPTAIGNSPAVASDGSAAPDAIAADDTASSDDSPVSDDSSASHLAIDDSSDSSAVDLDGTDRRSKGLGKDSDHREDFVGIAGTAIERWMA
jgi:hypothetical protein